MEQQYFQIRGAYYMRKYGYFDILRAKVGVRIIGGCVLCAENYGMFMRMEEGDMVSLCNNPD